MKFVLKVIPQVDIEQQRQAFEALKQRLGKGSPSEVESALAARELVDPEPELNPDAVARLRQRIQEANQQR